MPRPPAAHVSPITPPGGTLWSAALAMIDEVEAMQRGRDTAPVGWTDKYGDGEWDIALRCAELSGARVRWPAH